MTGRFWILVTFLLLSGSAACQTDTLVILHTNDLHDHVRPGYDGIGGIPYVSGYIKSVKDSRSDVLLLDAGDVMEKGDMVAFETHSEITFEAMGCIGYDACAVGNHDYDWGPYHVRQCEKLANGMAMLSINWIKEDGRLEFPASKVFNVDGVKVGVIGVLVPQDKNCLDFDQTASALKVEAERLEPECHLIVALCHLGLKDCVEFSEIAPNVDVFVSGHTHVAFFQPRRAENEGPLIVQAGSYARYVGNLEIEMDLATEEILDHTYELVEMAHDKIPCDTGLLETIEKKEQEVCPEATKVVGSSEIPLSYGQAGWLAAASLKDYADADIGFCQPSKIIRSGISPGELDVNALFLTGGERGHKLVATEAKGRDIESYVSGLLTTDWGETTWSGFRAKKVDPESAATVYRTDLDPEKTYRVVMPYMEWDQRFTRWFGRRGERRAKQGEDPGIPELSSKPCEFGFIEAVTAYAEGLTKEGITIDEGVRRIVEASKLP
jgi:2',3'-cyclic-nucleotide 2'-phosphodiesterase (5'-nucleotidase family)